MTYRATKDIFVGPGVAAYRVGDIVPDSAADNSDVKDKVAKEGTKAALAATGEAPQAPRASRSRTAPKAAPATEPETAPSA